MSASANERRSRVCDAAVALRTLKDGDTLGVGGFINSGHPMSLVRHVLRSGVTDLTVVGGASAGLEVDLMVAAGAVSRVISPYVGAEGLASVGPAFRKAAQDGMLRVSDLDEAHFYAGLRASAQRVPFNPWKAGVGTSYPDINPDLVLFREPIRNELMIAVAAIELDVCIVHAARSDHYGNVQYNGTHYGDQTMAAAARYVVAEVEQLVSNEEVRRRPESTVVAGADAIVRAPFGAHPFSADGYYPLDLDHIREYLSAAEAWLREDDRTSLDAYLDLYVYGPEDHFAYLERIGMRGLFSLSEY
ncbi:MAG: putative CoA-transferase alpha subunit [Frankiales bacterium]|nr:putative CoA-transferase alpha subunit [Frankiales bacterium]